MKEEEPKKKKLKPVVFINGDRSYYRNNVFQQNLLLKAMQVTSDPTKLRDMVGLKTVTEVYRTLDKLSIRKEFHEALARSDVSLDYIVGGIKGICDTAPKDGDRLRGYQTLLKALGLDSYEESAEVGKGWEELLLKLSNEKSDGKRDQVIEGEIEEYKVKVPKTPEKEKEKRIEEEEIGRSLYE